MACGDKLAGDRVRDALKAIGVDEAEISAFLGVPCGCEERRQRLNSLDLWARRVLSGKLSSAKQFLYTLLSGE